MTTAIATPILNFNELKKASYKNDPNFISTYLTDQNMFDQLCKNPRLFQDIFRSMIKHNNIQVLEQIIGTNGFSVNTQQKFSVDSNGFYEIMKMCCASEKNEITNLMWKYYNYKLPNCIFDSHHNNSPIIKSWCQYISTLDDSTQTKEISNILRKIVKYSKNEYYNCLIENPNIVKVISKNINDFLVICMSNLEIMFSLIDQTQWDFGDFKTSMKIMFSLIDRFNNRSVKNRRLGKKIVGKHELSMTYIHKDRIFYTIEKIWELYKVNIFHEVPDDSIEYDNFEQNEYIRSKIDCNEQISTTIIMLKIIYSYNEDLFKLGMSKGFVDCNISKWYRNIIMYSTPSIFELYRQTYCLNNENIRPILNIIWRKYTECDMFRYSFHNDYQFFFHFIENFDRDTFVIDSEHYSFVANFIISRYYATTYMEGKILSMNEYWNIVKIRPDLNNDDFMFEYACKNSYCFVFDEARGWDSKMIDKFYQRYLDKNIGWDTPIENIQTIFVRHNDPSKYTNIDKFIITVLKSCNIEIIDLVIKFFTGYINFTAQDHMIFRSVFEIGDSIISYQDTDARINHITQLLCSSSHLESGFYQVYIDRNHRVIGYRYGTIMCGVSEIDNPN